MYSRNPADIMLLALCFSPYMLSRRELMAALLERNPEHLTESALGYCTTLAPLSVIAGNPFLMIAAVVCVNGASASADLLVAAVQVEVRHHHVRIGLGGIVRRRLLRGVAWVSDVAVVVHCVVVCCRSRARHILFTHTRAPVSARLFAPELGRERTA